MAPGRREGDATSRQREPTLLSRQSPATREAARRNLTRLWAVLNSPAGEALLESLRTLRQKPPRVQDEMAALARQIAPTAAPADASKEGVVRWIVDHALASGSALPGLKVRDLFVAFAELVGYDEDLAAIMDGDRNWRTADADAHKLDQAKIRTQRSRLNARRKKHGYGGS